MKKFSMLKAGVAPAALGLAFVATPAFAQAQAAAPADAAPQQPAIVVTGSRIANPNLTAVSPVTVVTAQEIKNQGTTRVEDMLNSLPQVFASEGSTDSNGASGIATVNLRNLGTVRTLVLINGRRLGAGDPTDVAADLNFIPASLIQNVQVLTGGASATYGSDALAGVVNFVLNKDFEGVQLDAQTSFYQHNNNFNDPTYAAALAKRNYTAPKGSKADGGGTNITLTMGSSLADGKGHITAYVGYRRVNAVTQGDRDFSFCGLTTTGTACGGSSTSANGRFRQTHNVGLGSTPVYAPTGSSYTLDPANPGTFRGYKSARDGFNYNPYNYYQRPDTRWTAGVFAHYDINEHFKPYMEFMFMDDHTKAQIAPSGAFYGTDFMINCNNPLMSASQQAALCGANAGTSALQSVYIGRRDVEGGPRTDDLRHTDYRAIAGITGDIADGVTYDVYGQLWRSLLTENYQNDFSRRRINNALNVVTGPNGTPVCAAAIPNAQGQVVDPNCVPWNIFSPGGVTPAAVGYLATPGFQSGSSNEYVVSASISADLGKHGFQSPAADKGVQLAVGAEYRKERVELKHDIEFLTGDLAGQGTPFGVKDVNGGYTVREFFAEAGIPLVTGKPGIETLGLDVAYRYSDYSLTGSTNTYKIEGEYAPVQQVRFRASYNRAVRAPNSLELFTQPNVGLFGGQDPCVGAAPTWTLAKCALTGVTAAQYGTIDANPANQYNQQTSGNTSLRPESADTVTLGVVLQPIRRMSLSVDAYSIKVKNLIGTIGSQTIINNCGNNGNAYFCSLIQRDASGSLWTGTGMVINHTLNLGSLKTRGIDINANYRMPLGANTLSFEMVGSYLDQYVVQPIAGVNDIGNYDCAGLFGNTCGYPSPRWRHKARVTWASRNGLSLSAAWRYFGPSSNDSNANNPLLGAPGSLVAPSYNIMHISPVNYFDLAGSARIGDHYTFRMGVQNLLDKTPPVTGAFNSNGSNTYAQMYDVLGRYIYAAIQLNF